MDIIDNNNDDDKDTTDPPFPTTDNDDASGHQNVIPQSPSSQQTPDHPSPPPPPNNNPVCADHHHDDPHLIQQDQQHPPAQADADPDAAAAAPPEPQDESESSSSSSSSLPPPDLDHLSQHIHQFIASLSNDQHQHQQQPHEPQLADPDPADASTSPDPPQLPNFFDQFFDLVEAKLAAAYDPAGETPAVKWSALTEEDTTSFLETLHRVSSLSKSLHGFSSDPRFAVPINRAGSVIQHAMSYAEEEFKSLLEDFKIHDSDPDTKQPTEPTPNNNTNTNKESDENPNPESPTPPPAEEIHLSGYSEGNLTGLVRLSNALIAAGYESECCHAYFVARRNALEESMQKLGFEKHSIDDVQKMQWESLERDIKNWIRSFQQWATIYCSSERKLSDTVFSDNPCIAESVFGHLAHGVTIQLLNFANAVALTKRSTEKLFKFLDIYETIRDNWPEIDGLMPEEIGNELKTEASIIRGLFGEAMILVFTDLESSIQADAGKVPVPGGAVHPLTKYTMNYLGYACEYKSTLDQVFIEHQKVERADSVNRSEFDCDSQAASQQNVENDSSAAAKKSSFHAQIIKIMDVLDANLDGKSKLYKDLALGAIFMMNNGRYMLKKIKASSELRCLIGEAWYRKKSSDLRVYHKDYQRETWGKLLGNFSPEGLVNHGKVSKPVLKERFKSFNAMLDEIHKTQSNWVVGDEQLQSELRVSISNMVIPAYRSFLGRYSQVFTPGRQTEKYVKFQPDDLENYIEELFDGAAAGKKKQ